MGIFNRKESKDAGKFNAAKLEKEMEKLELERKRMEQNGEQYCLHDDQAVKGIRYEYMATVFAIEASEAFKNKEYERTIAFITRELTYHDPAPTLLELRAKAYASLGDFESAMRDINQALAIMPNHNLCNYTKASILKRSNNYNAAIQAISKSITMMPEEWRYYALREELYQLTKQPEKAAADHQIFIELYKKQCLQQ